MKRRRVPIILAAVALLSLALVVYWPKETTETTWFYVKEYPADIENPLQHEHEKQIIWEGPIWGMGNLSLDLVPWAGKLDAEIEIVRYYYVYFDGCRTDSSGRYVSYMKHALSGWHRLLVAKHEGRLMIVNYNELPSRSMHSYAYVSNTDTETLLQFIGTVHRERMNHLTRRMERPRALPPPAARSDKE